MAVHRAAALLAAEEVDPGLHIVAVAQPVCRASAPVAHLTLA